MSAATGNRQTMERVMGALVTGDGRPFVAAMADDMSWTIIGSSPWSGTWSPKHSVVEDLLGALTANFVNRYTMPTPS